MGRYRTVPIEVDAEQWTGSEESAECVARIAHHDFNALDAEDRANCDDPDATAQLFERRGVWRLVYTGDWIVLENGSLHVCRPEAFAAQFEQVAE